MKFFYSSLAIVTAAFNVVSAENVTFSLQYVTGFFKQGEPSVEIPKPYPARMGLLENKTWANVDEYIQKKKQAGGKAKVVVYLRHGEGTHNVAIDQLTFPTYLKVAAGWANLTDAELTEKGRAQAKNASIMLDDQIFSGGLDIQEVFVSVLDRTLDTFSIAFGDVKNIPHLASEFAREVITNETCNHRVTKHEKQAKYPDVNFDEIVEDEDPWWSPTHSETLVEMDNRARNFLNHLFYEHDSDRIGVVAHSQFALAIERVIGHRVYNVANAEWVPFLLEDTVPATKPTTDKPSTDKPSTGKPSTDKPSTGKPATGKPAHC
ncbi:TPA: hypothetical protein N0F65_010307 [Lagenidium giganteum]|uniref:Phosphoglycerate mutase n=1 Tax=Lagenidium giganteum TaxID=4803 RepID=A0AAV2Z5K8_9STRA|nr:TPA: hypothetical protein N0F65_010307 [Lagenidium giganteum]